MFFINGDQGSKILSLLLWLQPTGLKGTRLQPALLYLFVLSSSSDTNIFCFPRHCYQPSGRGRSTTTHTQKHWLTGRQRVAWNQLKETVSHSPLQVWRKGQSGSMSELVQIKAAATKKTQQIIYRRIMMIEMSMMNATNPAVSFNAHKYSDCMLDTAWMHPV